MEVITAAINHAANSLGMLVSGWVSSGVMFCGSGWPPHTLRLLVRRLGRPGGWLGSGGWLGLDLLHGGRGGRAGRWLRSERGGRRVAAEGVGAQRYVGIVAGVGICADVRHCYR